MRNILLFVLVLFSFVVNSYAQQTMDGNRIKSYYLTTGVFNRDPMSVIEQGFEWPKGANVYAILSSGLTIAGRINGELKMSAASYNGEYAPGFCDNGNASTNSNFKLYKVSRGDNAGNNPDYANWGLMVPYGAPYVDVNTNGLFELGIDTPGVSGAKQTIFVCLTDGFPFSHNSMEGFGGGTAPLYSELHMTSWCYDDTLLQDAQFIKWDIFNKSGSTWDGVLFSVFMDGDLGSKSDDWIGCDPSLNLGYTYNGDNDDGSGGQGTYGTAPPAVGMTLLRTPKDNTGIEYGLTSFSLYNTSQSVTCEYIAQTPDQAYNYMKGFKRDGTPWIDPNTGLRTKFCFPGDPETSTGWTESDGRLINCNGDTTGTFFPSQSGDRKSILSTGDTTLSISNNSKVQIVLSQYTGKHNNYLRSVTQLKANSQVIQNFWQTVGIESIGHEIPESFRLHQNYPNPFNPSTKIRFDVPGNMSFVKLTIYDIAGKEIARLVNGELGAGAYEYEFDGTTLSSGMYFYRLEAGEFIETRKMVLVK